MRLAFNFGEGDCNDGYWGLLYNRNSGLVLADFASTGDCETTVTSSAALEAMFAGPRQGRLPDATQFSSTIVCTDDTPASHALGLGLLICADAARQL